MHLASSVSNLSSLFSPDTKHLSSTFSLHQLSVVTFQPLISGLVTQHTVPGELD